MYNSREDYSYNRARGYGDNSGSNTSYDIVISAYNIRFSANQWVCPREVMGSESK